jgi:hypothetical protein
MCDETRKILEDLKELIQGRPPIDDHVAISSVKPWEVDYRERKHIFIWLPVAQTLSFEEFGTGLVPAQTWINLGMPTGTRVYASGSSSLIDMMIRCTDEEIP